MMSGKNKIRMLAGILPVLALALILLPACGKYTSPGSTDNIEDAGYFIYTDDQQYYELKVTAPNCDPLESGTLAGAGDTITLDPTSQQAEIKFIFKVNPNLTEGPDWITVGPDCHIVSPRLGLDDDLVCGPWVVQPTPETEATQTITPIIWNESIFHNMIINGDTVPRFPSYGTVDLTIYTESATGQKVSATSYAIFSITCELAGGSTVTPP